MSWKLAKFVVGQAGFAADCGQFGKKPAYAGRQVEGGIKSNLPLTGNYSLVKHALGQKIGEKKQFIPPEF